MTFELKRASQGGAAWAFFMALILLNNYSSSLDRTWRSISVSLVPAILVGLQQNPYFVNPKGSVLLISSLITFAYMTIIQFNPTVRKAMEDPNADRLVSGISYASVAILFGIAFVIASRVSGGGYKII